MSKPLRIFAFDSGVGGLSAIIPLMQNFFNIHVDYLGDLANLPYGTKSPEIVRRLTLQNFQTFFSNHQETYDLAIIACNTASSHALESVQEWLKPQGVPVIGVIDPSVSLALKLHQQTPNKRIVVLGTKATITSKAYAQKIPFEIRSQACPLFVPLVEDALFEGPIVEAVIERYLKPLALQEDLVILGCTHYPFLKKSLEKLYPLCTWIEAGQALLEDPRISKIPKDTELESRHLQLHFTDSLPHTKFLEELLERLTPNNGHQRKITWSLAPV